MTGGKPRAWSLIRPEPKLRADAVLAGLYAAGFDPRRGYPDQPQLGDVLVCWNRYGEAHDAAVRVERAGGRVLVAENGYIGPGGSTPKFDLDAGFQGGHYLALALGAHNCHLAADRAPLGAADRAARWSRLGVTLADWQPRDDAAPVLICPNRSFGTPGRIPPPDWARQVTKRLAGRTRRPLVVRPHPGTHAPARPLSADLAAAWCVVTWHSTAGVHALAAGVPVLCDGPAWILKDIAGTLDDIAAPPRPSDAARLAAFQRLAAAQWTIDEIATGEPFRRLLGTA